MELQLKPGVLLNDVLFQTKKIFSGGQLKKMEQLRKEILSGVSISEAFINFVRFFRFSSESVGFGSES